MSTPTSSCSAYYASDHSNLGQDVIQQIEKSVKVTVEKELATLNAKFDDLVKAINQIESTSATTATQLKDIHSMLSQRGGSEDEDETTLQVPEEQTLQEPETQQQPQEEVTTMPSTAPPPSIPNLLGQPSPFSYDSKQGPSAFIFDSHQGTPGVQVYTPLLRSSDMSSPSTSSHRSPAQPKLQDSSVPNLVVVTHHLAPLDSSKPFAQSSSTAKSSVAIESQPYSGVIDPRRPSVADSVFDDTVDYTPPGSPVKNNDGSEYDSASEEFTHPAKAATKSHAGDVIDKEKDNIVGASTTKSRSDTVADKENDNPVTASTDGNKSVKPNDKAEEKPHKSPFKDSLIRVGQFLGISSPAKDKKIEEKSSPEYPSALYTSPAEVLKKANEKMTSLLDKDKKTVDDASARLDESGTTEDEENYEAQKFDIASSSISAPSKESEVNLDNTKTKEETEDLLFKQKCQLVTIDSATKHTNVLGLGDISIVHKSASNLCQVQMKRNQDGKICADFTITEKTLLKDKNGSKFSGIWKCEDVSEGAPKSTIFIVRFRKNETYEEFKTIFNDAVSHFQEASAKTPLPAETESTAVPAQTPAVAKPLPIESAAVPTQALPAAEKPSPFAKTLAQSKEALATNKIPQPIILPPEPCSSNNDDW